MNDRLTEDETEILRKLREQLARARKANAEKHAYYEARQAFESLNISIPPHLAGLPIAAGWPGTVVDVLEERLDWTGWSSATDDSACTRANRVNGDASAVSRFWRGGFWSGRQPGAVTSRS